MIRKLKIGHLSLIMIVFLAWSCCDDPVEIARFELTESEKSLIPYNLGENHSFIHTNNFEFDFKVIENKLEWHEHHDFCEWFCCGKEYFSYQTKKVILKSDYPIMEIAMILGGNDWGDYYPGTLNFTLNNGYSTAFAYNNFGFICDSISKTEHFDSLLVGNLYYHNVYKKHFEFWEGTDTSALAPSYLLFNEIGLLQIYFNNDESFTIKN